MSKIPFIYNEPLLHVTDTGINKRILFYTFFYNIESTQKFNDVIQQIGDGTPKNHFFYILCINILVLTNKTFNFNFMVFRSLGKAYFRHVP